MSIFVVDANIVLSALLPGEDGNLMKFDEYIEGGYTVLVPSLWHLEVTNVLLTKFKRKILTKEQLQDLFEIFQTLPVTTDATHEDASVIRHIWHLAMKHALTSYDATYLELALRMNCTLLTGDQALSEAAKKEGLI